MGRIGRLPSVPEEFVADVVSTSWSLAPTNPDPKLVVRAQPGELATQCPSCHSRLLIDVIGTADDAHYQRRALEAPVSSAMRHATQIAEDAPLSTAAELLSLSPRRMVVVVDQRHRPLGVLTHAHVLAAIKSHSRDQLSTVSALQAASSAPLLPARARLDAALRVLAREDRDFVLVVDEAGTLMGVLLSTDVLNVQARTARDPY